MSGVTSELHMPCMCQPAVSDCRGRTHAPAHPTGFFTQHLRTIRHSQRPAGTHTQAARSVVAGQHECLREADSCWKAGAKEGFFLLNVMAGAAARPCISVAPAAGPALQLFAGTMGATTTVQLNCLPRVPREGLATGLAEAGVIVRTCGVCLNFTCGERRGVVWRAMSPSSLSVSISAD
jgi:hypothetical protein